jgi:hypothetical protein
MAGLGLQTGNSSGDEAPFAFPQPMAVAIERSANPHFLLAHLRGHLTDEMAEKYSRSTIANAPHWVRPFFDYQTISDVHVMRHRLRFRTYKKLYDWNPFADHLLKKLLPDIFGSVKITPLDPGNLRKLYHSIETTDELVVIEGRNVSRVHPRMAAVYDVSGVVEIKWRENELTLKRSPLYGWEEIEKELPPQVTAAQ